MRIVTNKELSNYKVLPFDLYTENGQKILDAGEILTPGKIIMLKNYPQIYTLDLNKEDEVEPISEGSSTPKPKDKGLLAQILNFNYEDLDTTNFETTLNKDSYIKIETQVNIKYYYKKVLEVFLQGYYEEGLQKLNSLVAVLKSEVTKQYHNSGKGSRLRFMGEYELCHPLNVALISGLIAQKLDFSPLALEQIILAALLHDIGKLKINLPDNLALYTTNEEDVKSHTILGYKLIKDYFGLPENIAKVALEHHENNDGSGYPQGHSNDFISEYSQIINVANFYDNLAFNRTSVSVVNNKEALRNMLEVGTKKFSAKMLYTFIHMFNYDDSKDFKDMTV